MISLRITFKSSLPTSELSGQIDIPKRHNLGRCKKNILVYMSGSGSCAKTFFAELVPGHSVTRWQDHFSIFGLLLQLKLAQTCGKNCQSICYWYTGAGSSVL